MTTHYLKIDQRWAERIRGNQKTAEVRLDDRDYQAGDRIQFTDDAGNWRYIERTITHVLREAPGLAHGYVVLSLQDSRIDRLPGLERENQRLERSNRSLRARARSLTRAALA
jgi:hypothetical protein